MNIFFYAEKSDSVIILAEEESKHCSRVLRLEHGSVVYATDGKGKLYECTVLNSHPKSTTLFVVKELVLPKRNYSLHIAIAPTKNIDRFEWFLEKCTEIGIDEITPLLCNFSERKIINRERLEKIVLSAMKQSLKSVLPVLNELISFDKFIASHKNFEGNKFIAHCYDSEHKNLLKKLCTPNTNSLILIGPEGDFSEKEVEMAVKSGFVEISLGDSRLRTETAGIAACNTVSIVNQ